MERMWGSWEGGSSSFLEKREQNVATSQEKAWGLYCYNSLGICVEWRQWYMCGHRGKCCFAGVPLMCWATCPRWCSFLMKRWGYVQSLGISNLAECFRCWLMLPLNGPACCNWNAQAPVNRGWKFINEFWPSEHGPWKSFWQEQCLQRAVILLEWNFVTLLSGYMTWKPAGILWPKRLLPVLHSYVKLARKGGAWCNSNAFRSDPNSRPGCVFRQW